MKIRHIRIRNLRAIDDLDLDLDLAATEGGPLDLAVLAGPNGCGKTSVLEACLWALKLDVLVPRPLPDQPYLIHLTVEVAGRTYEIHRTPDDHWAEGADHTHRPFPKRGLPDWLEVKPIYFSSWRSPRLIGSVGLSTSRKRRSARTQGDVLARLKQYLVDLQAASAFGGYEQSDGFSAAELFDRIADLWRELYPGRMGRFEGTVVNRQGSSTATGNEADETEGGPRYDIVLKDKGRPDGIPVDDLSSGEIEALSMIGSFVMESAGFDLVLVDEPELHLHPAWHRAIMRVLRRAAPEAQLICATHSEHILDAVYSHQRFTLLRETDPRIRLASNG